MKLPVGSKYCLDSPDHRFKSSSVAQVILAVGLVCVGAGEILRANVVQSILMDAGYLALMAAALLSIANRGPEYFAQSEVTNISARTWRWTLLGLGIVGFISIQAWFRPGTAIARGDISPPIGRAWISRLFSTFSWSGSNLGGPANNQIQLPLAVLRYVTHLMGMSGASYQRLWLSILAAGIFVAAGVLARSLRLSPLAGTVVAVSYFYNPMTMSQVGINDVYLLAMVLLPLFPAVLIVYGRGQIGLGRACLIFVGAAPLVGYTFSNPPLVIMLAATTAATPILVLTRFGSKAAVRSVQGLLVTGATLIGACSYWLIPSYAALASVGASRLSSVGGWSFTESRATLANALWLNTTWGWSYSGYFPFAFRYRQLPLELVRAAVPIWAFGGLVLSPRTRVALRRNIGLMAVLAAGVLGIALFTTGTRPPGAILFDPIYRLPYGWLLREPGRFLMVSALGYALLGGLLVESLRINTLRWRLRGNSAAIVVTMLILITAVAGSYPLWTGSVVGGSGPSFPPTHVRIPSYWPAVATYANSAAAPSGSLLVLPPDDFYQMPYKWYYGNDGFIVNLFARHVVVPSGQGYSSVSGELLKSVELESSALIDRNWLEAERILSAIGTPLVLVRGDIEANFPGRSIAPPRTLIDNLRQDPKMKLIYHAGPLFLFERIAPRQKRLVSFATINTDQPNLELLSLLPKDTALVTSRPLLGHVVVVQPPPMTLWTQSAGELSVRLRLPAGWRYSAKSVSSSTSTPSLLRLGGGPKGYQSVVLIRPLAQRPFSGGNLSVTKWGSVGNCNDATRIVSRHAIWAVPKFHGGPDGANALALSASLDSACVSKRLLWHGGPVFLRFADRVVAGSPARMCLWEEPLGRCAPAPTVPEGRTWQYYSAVIHPDLGTTSVTLFLYSDAVSPGQRSVDEYANITAESPFSAPDTVVIGIPPMYSSDRLITSDTGYSSLWKGPKGRVHVDVDGMRNGWIVGSGYTSVVRPRYLGTSNELRNGFLLTMAMAAIAVLLAWKWRFQ